MNKINILTISLNVVTVFMLGVIHFTDKDENSYTFKGGVTDASSKESFCGELKKEIEVIRAKNNRR